jgi:hypothetical protein
MKTVLFYIMRIGRKLGNLRIDRSIVTLVGISLLKLSAL